MSVNTTITIAGIDYTDYCDLESVEVDNNVIMRNDTMKVNIELRGELPTPKAGQEIIWTNTSGTREFGGIITKIDEVDIGADLVYSIIASSYEFLLDKKLVINYYSSMLGDALVKQIASTYCPGFTTNNVQAGLTVPPFPFLYEDPSKCIDKVAQQIEYTWYVDYYKDIHWFPFESFVSPLPNNTLNVDTDVTNYSDLKMTMDLTQLKTRIYIKGFKARVATPVTLTFTGDGNTKQWNLGYKPSRITGDITATIGGQKMTIKRDIADGAPGQNVSDTSSAFVNYSQDLIRTNFAPSSGTPIVVIMYYLSDTVVMRENPDAQAAQAAVDGTDGIYETAVVEQSLSDATMDTAIARGDLFLQKYAYPIYSGKFQSFTQGWRAGMFFTLNSTRRFGGFDEKVFVQSVKKKIVKSDTSGMLIQYEIDFADVPYLA